MNIFSLCNPHIDITANRNYYYAFKLCILATLNETIYVISCKLSRHMKSLISQQQFIHNLFIINCIMLAYGNFHTRQRPAKLTLDRSGIGGGEGLDVLSALAASYD